MSSAPRTSKTGAVWILCRRKLANSSFLAICWIWPSRNSNAVRVHPDGCIAEVYHALPPSARDVLRNGLQGMVDTLSFPTEWTEISAVLVPKCVGPQCPKDYRPLASLCAIRKLLGYVWMLSLPWELPWRVVPGCVPAWT